MYFFSYQLTRIVLHKMQLKKAAVVVVAMNWVSKFKSLHPSWHKIGQQHNTHLMAICSGLPRWAGTRKATLISILLKQRTLNGSGIIWAICKSAPLSRQITTPAPHHSSFYTPDDLPASQQTASKHWRHKQVILRYYFQPIC